LGKRPPEALVRIQVSKLWNATGRNAGVSLAAGHKQAFGEESMSLIDPTSLSATELADRIAILRDNIRQITEQAASVSGAADEERNADRLAQQTDELDILIKEQELRLNK
jgi:uncharacterized small protein (DUF1192 family)